jgi:SnoaL-like domain
MKRHQLLIVLLLLLLGMPGTVWAGPKEDVAATTAQWGTIFPDDNPDLILALYAPDAVLWGTLSPTVRQGPAALREYFTAAFKVLPGHRVSFGDHQHRLLHVLLRQGRRDKDHPGAVQLRLREERPGLADRGSSLLGNAVAPPVMW